MLEGPEVSVDKRQRSLCEGCTSARSVLFTWLSSICCLLPFGTLACTLTIDDDRQQCESDADCRARGAGFGDTECVDFLCERKPEPVDPTWGCLGEPTPVSSEDEMFTVRMPMNNVLTTEPLPGMAVKLCRKLDVECSNPIDELESDDEGVLELHLPGGFEGYALLEDPAFTPSLYFFNPPVRRDQPNHPQWPIASPFVAAGIATQAGGQFNDERGLILLTTQDCQGVSAEGIRYESPDADADTQTFYAIDGLPTASATETDVSGYGGLFNVTAGALTVRAEIVESGERVGTLSLLARGGAITNSRIAPDVP